MVASRWAVSPAAWRVSERSSSSLATCSPRLCGGVQGAYEVGGGRGTRRERGGGVALGLTDGDGDACRPVGGGAVAQDGFGCLPGGVQGAGLDQLSALGGGALLGCGQRQGRVTVGQFGGDEAAAATRLLCGTDGVGGARHLLGEVCGAASLLCGPGGEPAGQGTGAALGARVDVAGAGAGVGCLDDPAEQIDRACGEVTLRGEFGPAAQFVAEAADQVGEAVRVAGVGDGAQQQVGEVGVLLDREETCGLALVGVHLTLVAEEFGVEAEVAEVLVPPVVDLFPVHIEVLVELARVREGVPEALHGAAPAMGAGGTFDGAADGGGLGDRQRVEAESGPGAEGVPGLGELAGVVGDLPSAPFADLADDHALAGEGVLPLQGDMAAVVGEQELAQYAGAGTAQGVAVAGQHHREDQFQQDRLAAAVLQEQHTGGRGAARRADRLLLEELRLGRRGVGHGLAHSAQVKHGVGVARTGRPDGVEADPGQLVHGGGLSSFGKQEWGGGGGAQAWKGRPASAASSRSSPSGGGSSVAVPSVTGTTPSSSSSAMAAVPAMSRTCSW